MSSKKMARSEKTTVIEDLLREKREEILRIAEKHGARNVRIFGSVAHGEATEASDIDLLVDTAEQTSPWFPAGLAAELEELLGQRVDVVTSNGLYWLLRRRILKEARPLGRKIRASTSPIFWSARKKSSATLRAARRNFTTIR